MKKSLPLGLTFFTSFPLKKNIQSFPPATKNHCWLFTFIILFFFLANSMVFLSCKKELSCEGCKEQNKPPIANAGNDQTITLPKDSVTLNGSGSTDPDGNITSYLWTKIAGPISANIIKPDSSKTAIKALVAGIYKFELTVTDNGGLSAKDTVQIMVDAPGNQPPVACAGADQTITLPATLNLNGKCSADPDNNITAYLWTKISGPAATIATPISAQTQVTGLVKGIYQFELKVTDAGGLFSKDTVQVEVIETAANACGSGRPQIIMQATLIATHPNPRRGMAVIAAGNKIFFAGGQTGDPIARVGSSIVDIYDVNSNTWSTAVLSVARMDITAITNGSKVFFAGGRTGEVDDVGEVFHSTVDIYDVATNSWSATSLRDPGYDFAAAAVGNKVLFAGGGYSRFAGSWRSGISNHVEIYDISTNTWSVVTFNGSVARTSLSVATLNNKAFFAGGITSTGSYLDKIEIYDNASGTWSTSTLSEPKAGMAGIGVENKVYWAGGYNAQNQLCKVEIKDITTHATSLGYLSNVAPTHPVLNDNRIIYQMWNKTFELYDLNTNTWSIAFLPANIPAGYVGSINNTIYMAGEVTDTNGSMVSIKLYKLQF